MDQLSRWEIPGIPRNPRRGGAIVKACPNRQYQIGKAASLIGGICAIATNKAKGKGVVAINAAHAVWRGDDRDAVMVDELSDLRSGFGKRCAMTDKQHRLPGLLEHL